MHFYKAYLNYNSIQFRTSSWKREVPEHDPGHFAVPFIMLSLCKHKHFVHASPGLLWMPNLDLLEVNGHASDPIQMFLELGLEAQMSTADRLALWISDCQGKLHYLVQQELFTLGGYDFLSMLSRIVSEEDHWIILFYSHLQNPWQSCVFVWFF
jgi:hypothetical protein